MDEIKSLLEINKDIIRSLREVDFIDYDNYSNGNIENVPSSSLIVIIYKQSDVKFQKVGLIEFVHYLNILINPFQQFPKIKYERLDLNLKEGNSDELKILKLKNNLPEIDMGDPVRIWNGWQEGDVIKITRVDGSVYYRIVV